MKTMINERKRLLVVDDEEDLCEILQFNLLSEGYDVDIANSAEEALEIIPNKDYSLILLDVMMEGMSGFKMAEKVKKNLNINIPIIFLTAKDTENDMLTGFSLGGDDYISKPFSVKEVIARIKAVLKRVNIKEIVEVDSDVVKSGDLVIDIPNKIVTISGEPIQLTKKEFDILSLLVSVPKRIFSREEILTKVWSGDTYVLDRTVDVHITRLRKKLGLHGAKIVNRSNYGYNFNL